LCCAHHRDYHFATGAEKAPQDRRRTRREEAMPTRSFARATRLAAVLALVAALCTPPAVAQQDASAGFPRQPLKLIVGFTAGGGNDIQARLMAQKLTERIGQPVIVENRAGAGGNIAAEFVARAAPDGYTLLVTPMATMLINPAVYSKLPYDPIQSFTPIVQLSSFALFQAVETAHPARSVAELVSWARANPDKANYGSPASIFQMTAEMFNAQMGTRFVHIPFKSSNEVIGALQNGQVSMAFLDAAPLMGQIKAGRLRVLATTGTKRWKDLPDAPTMAEVGVKGVEVEAFSAVVGPKNMPAPIVKRLETEFNQILRQNDIAERFAQMGLVVVGGTSEQFASKIARELPRWKQIAKDANIRLD
jgi:tripartite-type tricarboxylate transporter receptor subunit TctC